MARFSCLRPYLSTETVFLSSVTTDGKNGHELKHEKVGLMFSGYPCNYHQVSENTKYLWIKYLFIVSRGGWLWKPANIKAENNGAVVYVGSSPDRAQSFVFVHKLLLNRLMQCFYWSVNSQW